MFKVMIINVEGCHWMDIISRSEHSNLKCQPNLQEQLKIKFYENS